jgi:hypothetical protein
MHSYDQNEDLIHHFYFVFQRRVVGFVVVVVDSAKEIQEIERHNLKAWVVRKLENKCQNQNSSHNIDNNWEHSTLRVLPLIFV